MKYFVELKAIAVVKQSRTVEADSSEEARSKALSTIPYHKWKFDGVKDIEQIEMDVRELEDE